MTGTIWYGGPLLLLTLVLVPVLSGFSCPRSGRLYRWPLRAWLLLLAFPLPFLAVVFLATAMANDGVLPIPLCCGWLRGPSFLLAAVVVADGAGAVVVSAVAVDAVVVAVVSVVTVFFGGGSGGGLVLAAVYHSRRHRMLLMA